MEEKTTEITVTRRQFFKLLALAAAGAAVGPKVLDTLLVEDTISQAQLLEAMNVFSSTALPPQDWVAVMHPETYQDLMSVLGSEIGRQAGEAVDRLVMGIEPEIGEFMNVRIQMSEYAPEHTIVIPTVSVAEDATINVEVAEI